MYYIAQGFVHYLLCPLFRGYFISGLIVVVRPIEEHKYELKRVVTVTVCTCTQ